MLFAAKWWRYRWARALGELSRYRWRSWCHAQCTSPAILGIPPQCSLHVKTVRRTNILRLLAKILALTKDTTKERVNLEDSELRLLTSSGRFKTGVIFGLGTERKHAAEFRQIGLLDSAATRRAERTIAKLVLAYPLVAINPELPVTWRQ